jgi:hypothetical protein
MCNDDENEGEDLIKGDDAGFNTGEGNGEGDIDVDLNIDEDFDELVCLDVKLCCLFEETVVFEVSSFFK